MAMPIWLNFDYRFNVKQIKTFLFFLQKKISKKEIVFHKLSSFSDD